MNEKKLHDETFVFFLVVLPAIGFVIGVIPLAFFPSLNYELLMKGGIGFGFGAGILMLNVPSLRTKVNDYFERHPSDKKNKGNK